MSPVFPRAAKGATQGSELVFENKLVPTFEKLGKYVMGGEHFCIDVGVG